MRASDVPEGYSIGNASVRDAPAIADLVNEVNIAEIGVPLTDVDETRSDLTSPRERRHHVVIAADDGSLVGYLTAWADDDPFTEVLQLAFVRPSLWGRG